MGLHTSCHHFLCWKHSCTAHSTWHSRMEPLAQPLMPLCAAPPHSIPAALGTEPGSHFPICSTPWSPGQCCIHVMLHKKGCLNKQCQHNICYPALPIVFMEGCNQHFPPPKFKLMQGYWGHISAWTMLWIIVTCNLLPLHMQDMSGMHFSVTFVRKISSHHKILAYVLVYSIPLPCWTGTKGQRTHSLFEYCLTLIPPEIGELKKLWTVCDHMDYKKKHGKMIN